jgi:SAM-dependent methyltransferase
MTSSLLNLASRIVRRFKPDHISYQGVTLPANHLRLCGAEFQDDAYYLASSQREVERLRTYCGLTAESRLLDVGCGVGRLAIGLSRQPGTLKHYQGIDVSPASIAWCQRHIAPRAPGFDFTHIDARNSRYNPGGQAISGQFRLPFDDGAFDIIYLYSVFSHMTLEDVGRYLEEYQRLLSEGGHIFLTAFVEEGVPDVMVNPPGYRQQWAGELHCVRYNKDFFERLLNEKGFAVDHFVYGQETDGQSAFYLSKMGSG